MAITKHHQPKKHNQISEDDRQQRLANILADILPYLSLAPHIGTPIYSVVCIDNMFKKKTLTKKRVMRRRDDDEDDDDPQDDSVVQQIQQTRQKRRMLTAVQYKRGVDTVLLSQKEQVVLEKKPKAEVGGPQVKTAAETSKDGTLDGKHRHAMEAFIEERMGGKADDTANTKKPKASSVKPLTEEALYMDLAASAARLSGKPLHEEVDEEKGAVMVGGTGIAEVILPVSERLKVAKDTEAAKASRPARPMRHQSSQGVPNRFHVANAMSQSEFQSRFSGVRGPAAKKDNKVASVAAAVEVDEVRPGFDAVRHPSRPTTQSSVANRDRASDSKVYSKFVARQRDMRK